MKKKNNRKQTPNRLLILLLILTSALAIVFIGYTHNKSCITKFSMHVTNGEKASQRFCLPTSWREYKDETDFTESATYVVSPEFSELKRAGDMAWPDEGAMIVINPTRWMPKDITPEKYGSYHQKAFLSEGDTIRQLPHARYTLYSHYFCEHDHCVESRILVNNRNLIWVAFSCADCHTIEDIEKSKYYGVFEHFTAKLDF